MSETGALIKITYWYQIKSFFKRKWYQLKYKINPPESNYIKFAKRELEILRYDLNQKEEDPNKWIVENVLELLRVFDKQGHSGSSAPFCIEYFRKLASFEPLTPLTGEHEEWNKIGDKKYQNKRCSHVFETNGQAYDIEGIIFKEKDGGCYTSKESHVNVKFPYIPKRKYVEK